MYAVTGMGDTENLAPEPADLPAEGLQPQPAPARLCAAGNLEAARSTVVSGLPTLCLLISKFVVLIGYMVLRPFTGWHVRADAVQSDTVFLLIQQCVFYVFILGFLFLSGQAPASAAFLEIPGMEKAHGKAGGGIPCRWCRARRGRQPGVMVASRTRKDSPWKSCSIPRPPLTPSARSRSVLLR